MKPSTASLPVIVSLSSELWVWLDEHVARFPVRARASMGRAITDTAIALMRSLVVAAYAPVRSTRCAASLDDANGHLALLRLLVEGAAKRKHLSLSQHDHAVERMGEIGRMLGGWIKKLAEPRA